MSIALVALALPYVGFMLWLAAGLLVKKPAKASKQQGITVIVAARNEQQNLPQLIKCLRNQKYSNYQVIIADDRSTDDTATILQQEANNWDKLTILTITSNLPNHIGKKNALAQAIALAQNDILAFTDADCLPPPTWLQQVNTHFDSTTDCVVGYSPIIGKGLTNLCRNLERAAIYAVAAGSVGHNWGLTCTGRNFAYRKSVFNKAGGYSGISMIKSGDDDLLIQKLGRVTRGMRFMFGTAATIPTLNYGSAKQAYQAEVRRASKFKVYPNSVRILTAFLFSFYLLFTGYALAALAGLVPYHNTILYVFIAKTLAELTLIGLFTFKVKQIKLLLVFPGMVLFYLLYFIYFGIRGTLGRYSWKN